MPWLIFLITIVYELCFTPSSLAVDCVCFTRAQSLQVHPSSDLDSSAIYYLQNGDCLTSTGRVQHDHKYDVNWVEVHLSHNGVGWVAQGWVNHQACSSNKIGRSATVACACQNFGQQLQVHWTPGINDPQIDGTTLHRGQCVQTTHQEQRDPLYDITWLRVWYHGHLAWLSKNWVRVTTCTISELVDGGAPMSSTPQAVNGGWSAWTHWGSCSQTCDGGLHTRTRLCNNPSPQHGGHVCSDQDQETQRCSSSPCIVPVDGGWSLWTQWGSCSQTCDRGLQTRSRLCNNPAPQHGGHTCQGMDQETQGCSSSPCNVPVDGGWSLWTQWGSCSQTCDGGLQTRTRLCNNPPPQHGGHVCSGQDQEIQSCSSSPCQTAVYAVNGGWGAWSAWSVCSATSGGTTRHRLCDSPAPAHGGSLCHGPTQDSKICTFTNVIG